MSPSPARSARISLFFMSTMNTSFIRDDVELLGRHFDVDVRIGSGLRAPLDIVRRARRADVSFSWFGSVYTAFMVLGARLGRRRSIVMLGGVDTARAPELGYGIWLSPWRRPLLRWALRRADAILAVDASLLDGLRESSGLSLKNAEVVPTGYDVDRWTGGAKEDHVLTVAACDTVERARLKGIDLFVEAARVLPHVSFRAIGIHPDVVSALASDAPANLELHPPLPREELVEEYRRAKIYCQVSLREGLPNALCEAMLSECIPIGTRVGGMPSAIGDTGFVIEKRDLDGFVRSIASAMNLPREAGARARQRIVDLYPRERRERSLVAIIERLAS